jgi:heptosyltransferase-2
VRHHPELANTIVFDKRGVDRGFRGLFRLARRLRGERYDMVLSLHKSYRTALLLRCAGIPQRYGFKEASAHWLYTRTSQRTDLSHEVLRNMAILRNLGHEPQELSPRLHIELSGDAVRRSEQLLGAQEGRSLVGIAPGSVWATKRWTPEGFAHVARTLQLEGHQVVLLGGSEDSALGAEIEQLSGIPLTNLIGKTSLLESAAVISRLQLLITNDSAPLHIGAARGIPITAIFCATVPEFGFGPWQVPHEVLGVDGLPCRPCGRHGGQQCPTGTNACQLGLGAEAVLAAARRLLMRRESQAAISSSGSGR